MQRVKDLVKESYRKKIQGDDQREKSSEYPNHDELYNDPDLKEQRESMSDEEDTSEASSSSVKSIGRGASSSGFPVLAPKRWGGVEAADSYRRYRPDDLSKKELKFKASNDFFSRKSFTELGCSDIIVESLRKMQYVRPSHIQVC